MDPLHTKAYAIFYAEIVKQLVTLEELLALPDTLNAPNLEQCRVIAHRIKGGSGFFGLKELGLAAAELEELLKQPLDAFVVESLRAQMLVKRLKELGSGMPLPE